MCLTCPKKACDGCPKVAKTPAKLEKKSNLQPSKRSEPKITLKIKKELIEKSHKKEKKEKKKEKKKSQKNQEKENEKKRKKESQKKFTKLLPRRYDSVSLHLG